MTTSDGKWVMGPPEKIWGPKGNAFATDIIQWRDDVVISTVIIHVELVYCLC
jgi:hypothetical protein